jgi:hypothetical protein
MITKTEFHVNNLSSTEIAFFYQFLYCYETVLIKYKNNKEIGPFVSQFDKYIRNSDIKLYTKSKSQVPNSVVTTNNKTIVLSFLAHLRNSIAHCLIVSDGDYFNLKDYYYKEITMNGRIEKNHLFQIIKIFIKPTNN